MLLYRTHERSVSMARIDQRRQCAYVQKTDFPTNLLIRSSSHSDAHAHVQRTRTRYRTHTTFTLRWRWKRPIGNQTMFVIRARRFFFICSTTMATRPTHIHMNQSAVHTERHQSRIITINVIAYRASGDAAATTTTTTVVRCAVSHTQGAYTFTSAHCDSTTRRRNRRRKRRRDEDSTDDDDDDDYYYSTQVRARTYFSLSVPLSERRTCTTRS